MSIQKSQDPLNMSSMPKKRPGWFSWRHQTNEEHLANKARRQAIEDDHLNLRVTLRKARAARSNQEQLKVLDKHLGVGQGALKERRRLRKQIEEARVLAEARAKATAAKAAKTK
jgi:hypothetical protein